MWRLTSFFVCSKQVIGLSRYELQVRRASICNSDPLESYALCTASILLTRDLDPIDVSYRRHLFDPFFSLEFVLVRLLVVVAIIDKDRCRVGSSLVGRRCRVYALVPLLGDERGEPFEVGSYGWKRGLGARFARGGGVLDPQTVSLQSLKDRDAASWSWSCCDEDGEDDV